MGSILCSRHKFPWRFVYAIDQWIDSNWCSWRGCAAGHFTWFYWFLPSVLQLEMPPSSLEHVSQIAPSGGELHNLQHHSFSPRINRARAKPDETSLRCSTEHSTPECAFTDIHFWFPAIPASRSESLWPEVFARKVFCFTAKKIAFSKSSSNFSFSFPFPRLSRVSRQKYKLKSLARESFCWKGKPIVVG